MSAQILAFNPECEQYVNGLGITSEYEAIRYGTFRQEFAKMRRLIAVIGEIQDLMKQGGNALFYEINLYHLGEAVSQLRQVAFHLEQDARIFYGESQAGLRN